MIEYVAFYGTLRRDHETPLHDRMHIALEYSGMCTIPGTLHDLGRLVGLKPGQKQVPGELYRIKDHTILPVLDEYEAADNEDPSLPGFSRKAVTLLEPELRAWVYFYDGPID